MGRRMPSYLRRHRLESNAYPYRHPIVEEAAEAEQDLEEATRGWMKREDIRKTLLHKIESRQLRLQEMKDRGELTPEKEREEKEEWEENLKEWYKRNNWKIDYDPRVPEKAPWLRKREDDEDDQEGPATRRHRLIVARDMDAFPLNQTIQIGMMQEGKEEGREEGEEEEEREKEEEGQAQHPHIDWGAVALQIQEERERGPNNLDINFRHDRITPEERRVIRREMMILIQEREYHMRDNKEGMARSRELYRRHLQSIAREETMTGLQKLKGRRERLIRAGRTQEAEELEWDAHDEDFDEWLENNHDEKGREIIRITRLNEEDRRALQKW
jgi:hypothetical protein